MPSLKRALKFGFLAAFLVAFGSLFLQNYYRSEVRILPVDSRNSGVGLGSLAAAAAAMGVNVPSGDGADANFTDILGSRWLQENLLTTEYTFKARAWRFGAERQHRESLYQYLEAANMDLAVRKLGPMLNVGRDTKTRLIALSVESQSPSLSQAVAKRCVQLLEEFVQAKGRTRGGIKAAFSDARMVEARQETAVAEDAFRRFLDGNRNYLVSSDPTVRLRGASLEAELKLRQQLLTTIAISREQALMEEKNDMPILNVLDSGNLPIEKSKPARSLYVLLALFLVTAATLAWDNREWILKNLPVSDFPDSGGPGASEEQA
jgi:hypothetical protein